MTRPVVFISYSHKDEIEKDQLVSHLKVLQSAGVIELWVDDRIAGGADWEQEIKQAIAKAKVAVLLITANFLTSDFILGKEVPAFLKRRKKEGLTVFPVIAKACAWRAFDWLAKMNVRPKNGRPIWSGPGSRVDEDLTTIAEEIVAVARGGPADRDTPDAASSQAATSDFASEETEHIKELIGTKIRRLHNLQLRAARSGMSTPPEVAIEIEDLENEIDELKRKLSQ